MKTKDLLEQLNNKYKDQHEGINDSFLIPWALQRDNCYFYKAIFNNGKEVTERIPVSEDIVAKHEIEWTD